MTGCSQKPDAQHIIDRTIDVHGGESYGNVLIRFDFRDRLYTIRREDGWYEYSRTTRVSDSLIVDEMDNHGFIRSINGEPVELSAEDEAKYTASVNSVVYFALLPYALNDDAVIKEYLGESTIENEPYYEIKITFKAAGGGTDHEDEFVYWIHQENYTMDYLAYAYQVEGGGTRFRKAVNPRVMNGIRFSDYLNYKGPAPGEVPLQDFDSLFQEGRLEKLSEIDLEEIQVQPLHEDVAMSGGIKLTCLGSFSKRQETREEHELLGYNWLT